MKARMGNAGRCGIAASLAFAAPAGAAELVLAPGSGHIVEASINGAALRLKVLLDESEGITLNPAAAARAGLGNGEGRWVQVIGPVKLLGRFTRSPVLLAGQMLSTPVRWYDRDLLAGADGTVSAHLLPFDSVTLQQRAPSAAERPVSLPAHFHDNHGIHTPLRLGKRKVAVRFSPLRARTVATAAAAAVIARHQGGALAEEGTREEIHTGVSRPVQALRLERPLQIGGFSLPVLMARTSDWRGDHALPPTESSGAAIVVRGARPSQDALYRMTVGQDVLRHCSSATYSKIARRLTFRCALP